MCWLQHGCWLASVLSWGCSWAAHVPVWLARPWQGLWLGAWLAAWLLRPALS